MGPRNNDDGVCDLNYPKLSLAQHYRTCTVLHFAHNSDGRFEESW